MRKLKMILVTCVVASSLFAAAGTALARPATVERGTSWTADFDWTYVGPTWKGSDGISWESFDL
jgi:opacity protein-like surface antigen